MDYYPTLQGMCEVVMNDDDGDAPSQEASESYLPPIPQFDLQSEHMGYLLQEQPLPGAPMVFDYDPYGTFNQPFQNILEATFIANTPKQKTVSPKVKKDKKVVNIEKQEKKERKEFLEKLFPKAFAATVFTKQFLKDQDGNKEEKTFYNELFTDVKNIELCRIHCTICDKHIGCGPVGEAKAETHIMLDVLVCKDCHEFYGDGKFPLDKTDDTEIYCRWCGQGGDQICCSFCPKVFCNKCVKRNYGMEYLKNIQAEDDWACFCCAAKPLWPLRAIRRALKFYFEKETVEVDKAVCCVKKQKKEKEAKVTPVKLIAPKPEWTGPNQPFVLVNKLKPKGSKTVAETAMVQPSPPRQTRTAMMAASPLVLPSTPEQGKVVLGKLPLALAMHPPPTNLSPKTTPKPTILGRPRITPVPLSRLTKQPQPSPPPKPQSRGRGRPRLHPLPSLTPQPSRPAPKSTPPGVTNKFPSVCRGRPRLHPLPSLTPQPSRPAPKATPSTPNKPPEPPTVVIDHSYQKSLAVRIKIPSKPDQFLRINVVGSCMRVPPFPPPQKRTFVQHCLKQAFRASEMSYHNLMSIVGNIENHSENENKDAVLAYLDKWKRVIGTLEDDVRRNSQKFDAKTTQSNVIDIDDDNERSNDDEVDGLKWDWLEEATRLEFGNEDVQILEEKPKNINKRKVEEVAGARKRRKTTQDNFVDRNQPGPSNGFNGSDAVASNGYGDVPMAELPQSSQNPRANSATPPSVSTNDTLADLATDPLAVSAAGDSRGSMTDPLADSAAGGSSVSTTDTLADSAAGGLSVSTTDPLLDAAADDSSVSTTDPPVDSAPGGSSVSTTDPLADSATDGPSVPETDPAAIPVTSEQMETNPLPDTSNGDDSGAQEPVTNTEGLRSDSDADLLPDVLNGNVDLSAADPLIADPLSVADFSVAHPLPDSSSGEDSENLKIEKLSRVIEEICDSSLAQHGAEPDLLNLLDGDLVLERQND